MKQHVFRIVSLLAVLCICLGMLCSCSSSDSSEAVAAEPETTEPTYVIFMVPDGMGLSNVTAARIYKNGINGAPLNFETLPYIGYQRTHSRNSTVTDSAAAASAWASGDKFNNGEISCLDNNEDGICDQTRLNEKTVLEIAQDYGMATGLVATSDITHATPAVFGAHVHNRKCESEIFEQFIDKNIDVLLGGGAATNRSSCLLEETDDAYNEALIQKAINNGYVYTTDKTELNAARNSSRLLGLFNDGGMTPICMRGEGNQEPTLTEMTSAALDVLEENPNGFFLMVEGSQIDWANHARNAAYQIEETIDFDNSVKTVLDWMYADESRINNTLLIVVPDHETGGVLIDGPYGRLSSSGKTSDAYVDGNGEAVFDEDANPAMSPDLTILFGSNPNSEGETYSAQHTAVDTLIWSNSLECSKALDNTDLYYVMTRYLQK